MKWSGRFGPSEILVFWVTLDSAMGSALLTLPVPDVFPTRLNIFTSSIRLRNVDQSAVSKIVGMLSSGAVVTNPPIRPFELGFKLGVPAIFATKPLSGYSTFNLVQNLP
jgi:hypothetical protein